MEKEQYIPEGKMILLEEAICWLSDLKPEPGISFVVGNSLKMEDRNIEKTELLQKLVQLNQERAEVLAKLLNSGN